MKKILQVVFLSVFSAMVFANNNSFENEVLMSKILPLPLNGKWEKLDDRQLPPEFSAGHPLTKGRVFTIGCRVSKEKNLVIILEVERPYLDAAETFCRSRVSVYYLYDYELGSSYKGQFRNVFIDMGEFVNFKKKLTDSGCPVKSYQDLKDYTFIQSLYGDDILIPLFKEAEKELSKGDALVTIGVSRSGPQGRGSSYYAVISRENGVQEFFNLSLNSTVSFKGSPPYVVD